MIDDVGDIAAAYANNLEREHLRLERHQLERDLTWRYFEAYLPPRGRILEIGAATGGYTLELAKRGHCVTAVDLTAALLDRCQQRLTDAGLADQVCLLVSDARDLHQVERNAFDAVLLMGPLYHLVLVEDRQLAVRQAYDRLRADGVIFSAFVSRFGIFGDILKKMPEWIERQNEVRSVLERGQDPEDIPHPNARIYVATVPEVVPLHKNVGFETLVLAGVEPAISADDESYNRLQGKQREMWLDLLYEVSAEPTVVGASRHLLYIGRKRGK
jgi:SAM-dependent methyltransferase